MPRAFEIFDAEQLDARRQYLLLDSKQRRQLGIARVQIYLDDRVVEQLKSDEAQVPHGKCGRIVVGFGVPQCSQKFGAVLDQPLSFAANQHRQAFQEFSPTMDPI